MVSWYVIVFFVVDETQLPLHPSLSFLCMLTLTLTPGYEPTKC